MSGAIVLLLVSDSPALPLLCFHAYRGASVSYVTSNLTGLAGKEASKADVAILFLSTAAAEGKDRTSLSLSRQQVRPIHVNVKRGYA